MVHSGDVLGHKYRDIYVVMVTWPTETALSEGLEEFLEP